MKNLVRRASNLIKSWIDYIGSRENHKIGNIEDTILISGAPRSRTTWLMEILSVLPAYKTIFEPLHRTWFPFIQRLNLPPRVYLPPERNNAFLYSYLYSVFKG